MSENIAITNERIKTELSTNDFYYDLPQELIAQKPSEKRDMSRLLILNSNSGEIEHKNFYNIEDYINPEDILVVNSSKVILFLINSFISLLVIFLSSNFFFSSLVIKSLFLFINI